MDNTNSSNSGGDEQTLTIVIILIIAIVIFFLVVAWCGFFYGLWRNKKVALDISRTERYRWQQQYRRQQILKQQQQQHNTSQQILQQQQQLQQQLREIQRKRYPPQQQQPMQQQQQQLRQHQMDNASRSRPSSQLSPVTSSHSDITHQPELNSHSQTPYYGEIVSIHSGYISPAATAMPVFIPPRDYDDDDDQTPLKAAANGSSVSSGLSHGYHNRNFDYFEGSSSPDQSYTNIGYRSMISSPSHSSTAGSNFLSGFGHGPIPPQSTSTPLTPKIQVKQNRTSRPVSLDSYSMGMQQYQQLQHWPQNY